MVKVFLLLVCKDCLAVAQLNQTFKVTLMQEKQLLCLFKNDAYICYSRHLQVWKNAEWLFFDSTCHLVVYLYLFHKCSLY